MILLHASHFTLHAPAGSTAINYLTNLARLFFSDRLLRPLIVAYTPTTHCNLNCVYCEDFGARRNAEQPAPLALEDALRVLRVIRQATDSLLITGGEPLLYPHLEALLYHARHDLKFRNVTLLTNAVLLGEHLDILKLLTRLMISVDAVAPDMVDATVGAAPGTAGKILDNVVAATARQKADGFKLVLNCVATPQTLAGVEAVLDFCTAHGMLFSLSPQSLNNWPRYDLLVSEAYRTLIARLIERKRAGAPILGSMAYLRMVQEFEPYACYPLLVPRVMSDGGLAYPCRPIEREGMLQGGRAINLLEVAGWTEAVQRAIELYGDPPCTCGSCYQQCYIESSLMQTRPWEWAFEWLRYAPSREGQLWTYAPG
ncbi:MAG: radical SAM protein [Anaerolineae bacterium]|nr:radical SAM protein [Anaerolineae bacterium]